MELSYSQRGAPHRSMATDCFSHLRVVVTAGLRLSAWKHMLRTEDCVLTPPGAEAGFEPR